jgi:flagellar biosynthesis/type III secretory pathway M-ring protein FliF/YscJ
MNDRPSYGDAEAKRIIERAAEIDAERGHQVNVPALRAIAAEAGISPVAVDQAIQEHESAASARAPWLKRHPSVRIIAAIVAGLLLVAFLRALVPPQ